MAKADLQSSRSFIILSETEIKNTLRMIPNLRINHEYVLYIAFIFSKIREVCLTPMAQQRSGVSFDSA